MIYFFASIIGRVTYLFQFVTDIGNGTEVEDRETWVAMEPQLEEGSFSIFTLIGLVYIGICIILAIICVFLMIPILTRDDPAHEGTGKRNILRIIKNELNIYDKLVKSLKTSRIKNKHPVRKMVHEFERKTMKQKIGRRKSETLNEWFERIGLGVSVNVYQKVRYGNLDVTEREMEMLRLELERVQGRYE